PDPVGQSKTRTVHSDLGRVRTHRQCLGRPVFRRVDPSGDLAVGGTPGKVGDLFGRGEPAGVLGQARDALLDTTDRLGDRVQLVDLPGVTGYCPVGGQVQSATADPVCLVVVRVPITAVLVIADQYLRAHLADGLRQQAGGLVHVGVPERLRVRVALVTHHSGVTVAARASEETVVTYPQGPAGTFQLADPVLTHAVVPVRGQVRQLGWDDLTLFTQSAGDQGHPYALGRVLGQSGPGDDALVVGVRVYHHQSPVSHLVNDTALTGVSLPVSPRRGLGAKMPRVPHETQSLYELSSPTSPNPTLHPGCSTHLPELPGRDPGDVPQRTRRPRQGHLSVAVRHHEL